MLGKRLTGLICRYSADFSKYLPYIVPHKRDEKKMFCMLTKTVRVARV